MRLVLAEKTAHYGRVSRMDADGSAPTSPRSVLPNGSDDPLDCWKGKGYDGDESKGEFESSVGYESALPGEHESEEDNENETDDAKWDSDGKPSADGEGDHLYMADLKPRALMKFRRFTFFKEFFYHTFFPVTVPLMYYLDGGWFALYNRGFIGWENRYLVVAQIFWAFSFYLVNAVAWRCVNKAKSFGFLNDVCLVDLLWVMRNLVVATKYGFLPLIEMEEMRTKKVPAAVHNFRTLLIAWRDPIPGRVLKYELLLSALRNKLTIRQSSFKLNLAFDSTQAIRDLVLDLRLAKQYDKNNSSFSYGKRAHMWLADGTEELSKDPLAWVEAGGVENLTHLPARLYTAHVIRQASSLCRLKRVGHNLLSAHLGLCASILGVCHAIIPVAGRIVYGGYPFPGPYWTKYCILVPSFLLTAFTMTSNLGFMMIGVLDFRRRHFIAESLDDLLRTGNYKGTQDVRVPSSHNLNHRGAFTGLVPFWGSLKTKRREDINPACKTRTRSSGALAQTGIFFDFSHADSLLAWWTCRKLMSNFGFGFYKRIKYCTTYFAGYCVILLGFLMIKALTGITRTDIYLLVTVIFSINVFLTLLALMVWPGGDTNIALAGHGTTLIRLMIRAQMRMIKAGQHLMAENEVKRPRASIEALNSIVDAVRWDYSKVKLSICGLEARDQLVSVIVAIVTASISIGLGQILQNGVQL